MSRSCCSWWVAVFLVGGVSGSLLGQTGHVFERHPFRLDHILVDDEWLPRDVVFADAVYDVQPWPNGDVRYRFDANILGWQRQNMVKFMRDVECVARVTFTEDVASTASDWVQIMHGSEADVSSSDVGFAKAFYRYSFLFSIGHLEGQGVVFGLGPDALQNWTAILATPPFSGSLDDRGSARIDLPPDSFPPGIQADCIFVLQAPTGLFSLRTSILEFDT